MIFGNGCPLEEMHRDETFSALFKEIKKTAGSEVAVDGRRKKQATPGYYALRTAPRRADRYMPCPPKG